MGKKTWTNAEDDRVLAMRREGIHYSEIARRLGKTKNAVLSRMTRLKDGGDYDGPTTEDRLRAIKFPSHNHCIWPDGHVGESDFGFCSAPVAAVGAPYCVDHQRAAWVKPGYARLRTFQLSYFRPPNQIDRVAARKEKKG